jgi:transcription-repair coupling factor (superfamily II helicase)
MSSINLSLCTLPKKPNDKRYWGELPGASQALALSSIVKQHNGCLVILVPDMTTAFRLERELAFFINHSVPILTIPDWETLPYDRFSPHQDIIAERVSTLYRLPDLERGVLIVPITTLMHRFCPQEYLLQNTFLLKTGDTLTLEPMRHRLQSSGYRCVSQVMEHGEFAIRGAILDLFPMGSDSPFRIDLWDNIIDSIRIFDPDTQRSLEKIDEIRLLPAREYPLTEEAISLFRSNWRQTFEGNPSECPVYLDVSQGIASTGLEYYLPLFFKHTQTLFDYLPKNTLIVKIEAIHQAAEHFWQQIKERYQQYGHDITRPLLEPKALFLDPDFVYSQFKRFPEIQLFQDPIDTQTDMRAGYYNSAAKTLPDISMDARLHKPLMRLSHFIETFKGPVLFCVESLGRREILSELLRSNAIQYTEIATWDKWDNQSFGLIMGPLEAGFLLESENYKYAIITESELLGKRVMQRRRRKGRAQEVQAEIRNLGELSMGDPVVHIEHGIGRYLGLTHLEVAGQMGEFVTLEYAEGSKLYVPVTSIQLISRYSSVNIENAPLHALGNAKWQKIKTKVLEQTRDVAAELLDIYAKREAKVGIQFQKPDEQYEAFAAEFPFEETPDQLQAIQQVIADLTAPRPMDRVICGDVGFGKTEVALRAAFMAVQSNKQVAVLVPTTLLAQQHYQSFLDRFSGFPIRIEVLSRFRTTKEQQGVIAALKAGTVDIVIGTHALLQKSIVFKSLGLLIIDEEHRFGVRQKEAFKAFRSEVDILTLTATPIPRTLNMAMSGIRDLSIIATPPAKRLSIKTFVREKNMALIQEAIERELHRGGQVYYLHNTVETIEKTARELEQWVPTARVSVAHGQMRERDLEQVMSDFYHRRYNVLVCTTIIETGIDVPTANTIIMDRADKLGLAQLHQLRGRVGRSHHQAYAFCLVPPKALMTSDAQKRLEALESLEELGSGFTLATHDLEIRGAGELLGEEQSGNIQAVGFGLFMELLDHAVKAIKAGTDPKLEDPFKKSVEIDLQIPAFIPEAYLPDVHSRLMLYKRLSNASNQEALDDLMAEMIDRFGPLPEPTGFLIKITALKFQAQKLGIVKIEAGPKGGRFEFAQKVNFDPLKIIQLIQTQSQTYQLEGPHKLRFKQELSERTVRLQEVVNLMNLLI